MTTRKGIRGSHQLVSRAFAFIFSWYKVIIALSLCFSSGALQHTVHSSIIAAKIVPLRFFFRAPIFRSGLEARSNKNSNTNPVSTKCWLQTAYRTQNADEVQNADCRPGTKCRLRIYSFFLVWYVITCHLTTYWASRNRFSAIIFHDYLHYCGIFLARFLITIVLNIVSSLHKVFSLCARADWCDVWIEFTNLIIKVDVDVNEMPLSNIFKTRNIRERIDSFARGPFVLSF